MSSPFRLLVRQMVLMFFLGENALHGTSIAFIRTDQEIVIAADSRSSSMEGNRKPDACKIRKAGEMYFTMVGQVADQGTDFADIAERFIRSGATLDSRETSFVKEMTPLLDRVLQSNPPAREIAMKQGSMMSILVYGRYAGTLVAHAIKFKVYGDTRHVVPTRSRCPGDCLNGNFSVLAPEGVLDLFVPHLTAVRNFVRAEINKDLPGIGGPIQIMRIDSRGRSHWIQKPAVCKGQN